MKQRPKTTQEVFEELHKAFMLVLDEIFKSLSLDILLNKLNKFLERR